MYLTSLAAPLYAEHFMKPYGKPTKAESTPGLSENDKVLQLAQAIINLTGNRTTDEGKETYKASPTGKVLYPTMQLRKVLSPDPEINAGGVAGEIPSLGDQYTLQQKWIDVNTGEAVWEEIPTVIEAPETPSPLSSPSEEIKTPSSPPYDAGNVDLETGIIG